jgi:RNA ligase (TIGR02306 family)
MSTEHEVRVVRLGSIAKHDNADSLGITEVDGRPCIVRLGEYNEGDLAVYIPIDSIVPTSDPHFAFLSERAKNGPHRVRAMRLRGVFSMGLLIRADPDMVEGDEVGDRLGITHYEAPEGNGSEESGYSGRDPGVCPVYDIESARKYHRLLIEGEEIVLTEKIHGANARFVFHDGEFWVGSRNNFKTREGAGMWWAVAEAAGLEEKLAIWPDLAVYGEVYGQVQDLKYGRTGHELIVFDMLEVKTRRWLDHDQMKACAAALGLQTVPEIYRGPWCAEAKDALWSLAEGASIAANGAHVREGWVLKPTKERTDLRLGRVIMKLHGEGYLTRKNG